MTPVFSPLEGQAWSSSGTFWLLPMSLIRCLQSARARTLSQPNYIRSNIWVSPYSTRTGSHVFSRPPPTLASQQPQIRFFSSNPEPKPNTKLNPPRKGFFGSILPSALAPSPDSGSSLRKLLSLAKPERWTLAKAVGFVRLYHIMNQTL